MFLVPAGRHTATVDIGKLCVRVAGGEHGVDEQLAVEGSSWFPVQHVADVSSAAKKLQEEATGRQAKLAMDSHSSPSIGHEPSCATRPSLARTGH